MPLVYLIAHLDDIIFMQYSTLSEYPIGELGFEKQHLEYAEQDYEGSSPDYYRQQRS